jgi:hypothetical protein
MRRAFATVGGCVLALALTSGCDSGTGTTGKDTTQGGDTTSTITWANDVLPILNRSSATGGCQECHKTGGIGTGSFLSDPNVVGQAAKAAVCSGKKIGECIDIRVHDGSMPLGMNCTIGKANCLTQAEGDTIAAWVAGGMK